MSHWRPCWPDLDIADALDLLGSGEISVVDLLEAHLARMEALDDVIHGVITSTADSARRDARDMDTSGQFLRTGILAGIPVGIKDNFETAAVRTTAATKVLSGHFPIRNSAVVDRLKRAGALCVGKLNMDELALGGPSGSDV